ncbi:hypothetical protein [Pseudoduganella aquatica]|uniref:hypothetical protein n=1 Tax=Pseudoduganella aquatica TaxID=2660641 RepID=UPI001E4ADA52|nr:hypothetical protein [Pseudoduganella aquatica]
MPDEKAAASCVLTQDGAVTTVLISARFSVCYEFDTTATNRDLALPYAVALNGKVLAAHADKPRVLDAKGRTIRVSVEAGDEVALYLNSDAHPDFRTAPVYAVKVRNRDVLVRIVERKGRGSHRKGVLEPPTCQLRDGKRIDVYDDELNGDIWLKISHCYTSAEAQALLPVGLEPTIRAAVLSIYHGLPRPELLIRLNASDTATASSMHVTFDDSDNARANITATYSLQKLVLPRTHPSGYAALLSAARAAGITELRVTSAWRPMLGSIAHRAGLGIDVSYAGAADNAVQFNRVALTDPKAPDTANVGAKEKALYADFDHAVQARENEEKARDRATKLSQANRNPDDTTRLRQDIESANKRVQTAKLEQKEAEKRWNDELSADQPRLVRSLRSHLCKNKSVQQLFDPWYMDTDTKDTTPPAANQQRSANEKLHSNHLHITVHEPKIL